MRVLIDIGHPAHVHLFKHVALDMQARGHEFLFTCREKEFEIELLEASGLQYRSFGKKRSGIVGKVFGMLAFDYAEWKTAKAFKPDLFMSHGSIYAAHAAYFMGKPHIALEDTYNFEQVRLYLPFSKYVLTADYEHPLSRHPKNISYSGYHETAYLHPNRFNPDSSVLSEVGLNKNESFVLLRFVSWKATHDIGHKGISYERKLEAIEKFSKFARVFISSEAELPHELKQYQLQIEPQRMHDLMAFASLLWAESFTMPAECSVLGTPSIIMHNTRSLYLKEQEEKYGLCFNYTESDEDQQKAIAKGVDILKTPNLREKWQEKKNVLVRDKIDLSSYLIWFLENYPKSAEIAKTKAPQSLIQKFQ